MRIFCTPKSSGRAADIEGVLDSLEAALDWLLLYVPESRVPKNLGSTEQQMVAKAKKRGTDAIKPSAKSKRKRNKELDLEALDSCGT